MGKKDMTAFCKVSIVKKDVPGEKTTPPPKKPKPPPKRKQNPARGILDDSFPAPSHNDSFPVPFDDDSGTLDFSELARRDDFPPEDEWEEVHESVGDDMSTGYPSDSEPTLIKETRRRPEAQTEIWTRSVEPEAEDATRKRYSGDELELEEEVF